MEQKLIDKYSDHEIFSDEGIGVMIEEVENAKKKLLEELERRLPEEISIFSYIFVPYNFSREEKEGNAKGFNSCRTQVLEIIKELK